MFKNIQKKLLLNHPLLWNIKVIPMGITVLGFNIIFFFLGFISGSLDFQSGNYYNNESNIIFFLITGLTSILTLIVWLIYYLKNNDFKSFYPKKENSLYWEWLLIFILLFGNCLYSFSYLQGVQAKERSYASKDEILEIRKLLNKIEVLIPESDSYYYSRTFPSKTDPVSGYANQTSDSISISLLNFHKYSYKQDSLDIQLVKKWLVEEKQDSIRNLINQYFKLQEKHKLMSNLNVDSWMKLIYNPPTYKVSPSNYIRRSKPYNDFNTHYVEFKNLESGYKKIYNAHYNDESSSNFILVVLYISLSLSLSLLSFRTTSGKSWLVALVIAGLLGFINGIITATFGILLHFDDGLIYLTLIYWLAVFFMMLFSVGRKIYTKNIKGKSTIMVNLILWMIPYVLMIFYGGFMTSRRYKYNLKNDNTLYALYNFFDDHPSAFFWINLIFVTVILFFVTKKIKKWRALPEE